MTTSVPARIVKARSLAVVVVLALAMTAAERAGEPTPSPSRADPVEALILELDDRDETTAELGRSLATLGGRTALADALETTGAAIEAERQRAALRNLLERYFEVSENGAWRPRGDSESFRAWLVKRCREWEQDVQRLDESVRGLRSRLSGTTALSEDLLAFLRREDAALQLYRELVRPKLRPDPVTLALRAFLEPDDEERLVVPEALRGAADRALEHDRTVARALDTLRRAMPALLERTDDGSPAHVLLERALRDDLGLVVVLREAGAATLDPVQVARDLLEPWRGSPSSASPKALRLLEDAADFRPDAEDALRSARWQATRLRDDDPALDGWRAVLNSPRALLLPMPGTPGPSGAAEALLGDTSFGRALVVEDTSVRINRHAREDLDRLLLDLARRSHRLRPLREQVEEFALQLEPGELRLALLSSVGQDVLIDASIREAGATAPDRFAAWAERMFERRPEGRVVRDDARGAARSLIDRATVAERELSVPGARTELALVSLDDSRDGLDLLRSSAFFNPRTRNGARLYFAQFPDHHAVRFFGLFEWSARTSSDPSSFVANLMERRPLLRRLAATHEKLIVNINSVPAWLSRAPGGGTFEGGVWKDAETHPPGDMKVWKRLVTELARVVKDSGDVERYYEFWNEPDLEYWQGTLKEFLDLYEQTALTIREVDPDAKIGGCAVNRWDGRLRNDPKSAPLNYELIRFAVSRDLPLDFVSWHLFGQPAGAIGDARSAYEAELRRNGVERMPEFLVSEWSVSGRGTPYANPRFGETMLALSEAGLTAQTVSMWEDAHAKPDPDGSPPWGLVTQQGERKGTWYVHRFMDRLSRGSLGVTAIRRAEDDRTVVVSRKEDGIHDVLVWQAGNAPRLTEAVKTLWAEGFPRDGWQRYGTGDRFERAVAEGDPIEARWNSAFEKAKLAYDRYPVQTERVVLQFEDARHVEVLWAEAFRTEHTFPVAAALRNTVTVPLRRNEVLRLVLRVE